MPDRPTITVVLPNYNHGQYIGDAIQAILDQGLSIAALRVIDDGSDDESIEVIRRYQQQDSRVELIEHKDNLGVNARINQGLAAVGTELVIFSAADDKVLPGFFDKAIDLLVRHPSAAYCSAGLLLIDESGRNTGTFSLPAIEHQSGWVNSDLFRRNQSVHGNWVMGNTVIYRVTHLRDLGGFPIDLASYADGFCTLLLGRIHGVCYIDEPFACWRRSETQYSARISRDTEKLAAIMRLVTDKMRGTHGALFTAGEINRWQRRWVYEAVVSTNSRSPDELQRTIKLLTSDQSEIDRILERLVGWATRHRTLFKYMAFLYLRPFDVLPGFRRAAARYWRARP